MLETTWSGQLRMCWNLPPRALQPLADAGICCPTLSWRLREAGSAGAQGSSRVGNPLSSLCTCLCLVPGVPDPGQRAPLGNVPAALQDPASKPLAELSRTPLPSHLGDSKLWGGARRATEPGGSMLSSRFIEERCYRGVSACLLQLGGDARPLGSPSRAGRRGGCFIPGYLIWGGWLAPCAAGLWCRDG